jgi:hypothetical protein
VSFSASGNAIRSQYFPTRNNISDFDGHVTNVAARSAATRSRSRA